MGWYMKQIFLSASVPERGRGQFDETSDPFLIQFAVRELITLCLGRRRVVWGGHPSITPMVHAVCQDFDMRFDAPVLLYQSTYFADEFPVSNQFFDPILVEAHGSKADSLASLRFHMLDQPIAAAVFIGGMEGIFEEYELFRKLHGPDATVLALRAPGGAARDLAATLRPDDVDDRIDFARLFQEALQIDPSEPRELATNPEPDTPA